MSVMLALLSFNGVSKCSRTDFFQFLIEAIQIFYMEICSQSLFVSKEEVFIF